jgi:hypothetical protein
MELRLNSPLHGVDKDNFTFTFTKIFTPCIPNVLLNILVAEIFLPLLKSWVNSCYLLAIAPRVVQYKTFNRREMRWTQDILIMR